MCGIVGFTGTSTAAKPILLEGLRRLEYRGYDSAGMALYQDNAEFLVKRCLGEVRHLVEASEQIGLREVQGIAHTRWATHGVPSEINAHPHQAGHIVLVHNGIIENHAPLRARLKEQGYTFDSQTDTEVFAKLIQSYFDVEVKKVNFSKLNEEEKKSIVLKALGLAMKDAEGHYAILFMVKELPGEIFGVQSGAPLVVAETTNGTLIASDLQPILPHTNSVYFLPQKTFFECTPKGVSFFSISDSGFKPISIQKETIQWSADQSAKGGFEHFMKKEIFEQPHVVAETLSGRLPTSPTGHFIWDHPSEHALLWKMATRIHLIACGTAYHAALTAKYFFEKWARIPVEIDIASEFRYRSPVFEQGSVVGVISQSGETADTLAALRLANEQKVPTFCICNVPGSTIVREAKYRYMTKAGPEVSVASTKAFTAQLTILCALAQDIAKHRGYSSNLDPTEDFEGLAKLPLLMEQVLAQSKFCEDLGVSLKDKKTILFIGRGSMYPLALEGALKLKEITYYHAEGYAAGELKHGPIALVDERLTAIVLAPTDELLQKTLSNLEEIKSRKGEIIGIGQSDNKDFRAICTHYVPMPKVNWSLAPMLYVIPLQLISYGLANTLGREIDKPRNLAKSVTVE